MQRRPLLLPASSICSVSRKTTTPGPEACSQQVDTGHNHRDYGEGSSIAPTNDRARAGSMDFYNTFHVVPDWLSLDVFA